MRRNRFHFTARHPILVLAPAHLRLALGQRYHGDALINWANKGAEVATDAFVFFDFGNRLARDAPGTKPVSIRIDQRDGLVRAIFAGNVTKVATDAFVVINFGYPLV